MPKQITVRELTKWLRREGFGPYPSHVGNSTSHKRWKHKDDPTLTRISVSIMTEPPYRLEHSRASRRRQGLSFNPWASLQTLTSLYGHSSSSLYITRRINKNN